MFRRIFLAFLIAVAPTLALYQAASPLRLTVDGEEYLALASALRDGSFWTLRDGPTVPYFVFHRSVAYSAILLLFSKDARPKPSAVAACHAVGTFLIFFALALLLLRERRALLPITGSGAVVLAQAEYFDFVLPEWFCLLILLLLVVVLVRYCRRPALVGLFLLSLLSACVCAMRAALLPVLIVAPAAYCLTPRRRWSGLFVIVIGLAPVILLSGANYIRFNSPKLSFLFGHQLAIMGALAGGAPPLLSKTEARQAERFQSAFDARCREIIARFGVQLPLSRYYARYLNDDHTLYTLFLAALTQTRAELGIGLLETDKLAAQYGWRAIKAHPKEYIQFVLRGLYESGIMLIAAVALTIALAVWLKRLPADLVVPTIVLTAVYLLYSLEVAALQYVIPRYIDPIFGPTLSIVPLAAAQYAQFQTEIT